MPFCSYKWGETTYMVGIIPLGGYVAMVGEGDTASDEEGEEDPRSFKNKSVGQRMLIISAGVIMNVIFAVLMAAWAYGLGVKEMTCMISSVRPGHSSTSRPHSAATRHLKAVKPNSSRRRTRRSASSRGVMSRFIDDA